MDTPSDEFAKFDQMLRKKKNQSPLDKEKDIESALDWCKNMDVSPVDDHGVSADLASKPWIVLQGLIPINNDPDEDWDPSNTSIVNILVVPEIGPTAVLAVVVMFVKSYDCCHATGSYSHIIINFITATPTTQRRQNQKNDVISRM